MNKLLSCLLSFTLLFTSVAPSFAQAAGSRVVRGAGRAVTGKPVTKVPVKKVPGISDKAIDRAVLYNRKVVVRPLQHSSWLPKNPTASDILNYTNPAKRTVLLRSDFPSFALEKKASPQEIGQAVSFYRKQLASPEKLFEQVSLQPYTLGAAGLAGTVADISSLGLLGNAAKDSPLIEKVYQASVGTVAEPVITAVSARALLRLGAYDTLQRMSAASAQQPELWNGIAAYAKAKHLPLTVVRIERKTVDVSAFQPALYEFGPLNTAVVDPKAESTVFYMDGSLVPAAPAMVAAVKSVPAASAQLKAAHASAPTVPEEELARPEIVQPKVKTVVTPVPETPVPVIPSATAPRWMETETTNALGNTVNTWQLNPAHPEYEQTVAEMNGPVPANRPLSWLDKARLQWAINFKPAFRRVLGFGKSGYGLTALGTGISPLSSEAVIARTDAPAIVQTIRAQQGNFISDEALRGVSGASYRTANVNPGGVSAQHFAQNTLAAQPTSTLGANATLTATPVAQEVDLATYLSRLPHTAGYGYNQAAAYLIPPIWQHWRWFQSANQRANRAASSTLSQQYPLVSALKNILNSEASSAYQEEALLHLYHLGTLSPILSTLPAETRQKVQELADGKQWDTLGILLLSLYHTGVISAAVNQLQDNTVSKTLLDEVGAIVNTPEFRAQAIARFNQQEVLSAAEGSFEGDVPLPTDTDIEGIASTFREKEGFTVPEGEDRGDVVFYEKNVPFYYRNSKGELSHEPVGVLSQEKANKLNMLLSAFPKQILADKPGFYIAKGFILVLDEQGQWKLMVEPGKLSVVETIPSSKKLLTEIRQQGSKRVPVDTPYTSNQLLAMAKMLENYPDLRLQLTLNAPSSFRQFLTWFGAYIGLDSANSLTGPYKKTMGVTAELGWPATGITNFIGGFGYVSPWIGGKALQYMTKWGYAKSIVTLFGVAGAALLASWAFLGMDGWSQFPAMVDAYKADPHNMQLLLSLGGQLALPLTVAVITGSLFGALVPIILNIYKDPTARTAANLKFATTKQWSRLGLTALTAFFGMNLVGGDWTIMVPAATVLLGVSALLFYNTPIMKNSKKEQAKLAKEKAEQEEKWRAAGLDPQKMYQQQKEWAAAETQKFKDEYSQNFRHTPEVQAMVTRVRGVYWAYAASLMMIGQIVNELLGTSYGQLMAAGFMLATLFMRTFATNQVSNKKQTDDQLTGMSIPLLAVSAALLTVLPYQATWIGIATALAAAAHYVGTAVPGQLDNTRMQNMVSAMIQEEKQAILDNPNLTAAERETALDQAKRKEKDWASRASASYSYANGWGEFGVLIAAALGIFFVDQAPEVAQNILEGIRGVLSQVTSLFTSANLYGEETNTLTMQRVVFAMSTGVLTFLSAKNWDLTQDFFRGLKKIKITQDNIDARKVSAGTFGITAKNAKQNLSKVNKEMDKMKEKMVIFGIVSEKKMTELYNQLTMNYNRLVAIREVEGMTPTVKAAFDKLFALAGTYMSLLAKHKMSMMLEREFENFAGVISVNGMLNELPADPVYVTENAYSMPQAHEKFEESKQLVQEMNLLAGRINNGENVQSNTYSLFIDYYNRVRDNLVTYSKLNVADSNRVLELEQEMYKVCAVLKQQDAAKGILEQHKGPVSAADVQALRDMLNGVSYENPRGGMAGNSSWNLGDPIPAY